MASKKSGDGAAVAIVTIAVTIEIDGVFYGPGAYRLDGVSDRVVAALRSAASPDPASADR